MDFVRIMRHFLTGQLTLRRVFPVASLATIELAIKQSEMNHGGEICFAVESALNTVPLLQGQTARERAVEIFSQLRIWDTEYNNGVLIYLLLADRDVEIIADRGISVKVANEEWENVCHVMESAFTQQQYEAGVINGINAVSNHLRANFPFVPNNSRNQLPDKPTVFY